MKKKTVVVLAVFFVVCNLVKAQEKTAEAKDKEKNDLIDRVDLTNQKFLSASKYLNWKAIKSVASFDLSKDPELFLRVVLPKGMHSRQAFNFNGGLKLNDGFTKVYSSNGFENLLFNLGFEWTFALTSKSDINRWKKESSLSFKGAYEQTNNTLFAPFVGNSGNPLSNISSKKAGTLVMVATVSNYLGSPKGRANIFLNNSITWKPKDNNIADLDDYTLTTIQTITDPVSNIVYNVTTDSKSGKYGLYKEINTVGLKSDVSMVFGAKQDLALNLVGNLNFKENYQTTTLEAGFYFPIKTTKGEDKDSKFAHLGIIAKTKDLNKSGSFSDKLIYGIKIGFPISK